MCSCGEKCSSYEHFRYHPVGRMFECSSCSIWSHVLCVLGNICDDDLEELQVPCHVTLHSTVSHSTLLCHTPLHCVTLHSTVSHSTLLFCTYSCLSTFIGNQHINFCSPIFIAINHRKFFAVPVVVNSADSDYTSWEKPE